MKFPSIKNDVFAWDILTFPKSYMRRMARKCHQLFFSIIKLISKMMDNFSRNKISTELLLDNKAMFADISMLCCKRMIFLNNKKISLVNCLPSVPSRVFGSGKFFGLQLPKFWTIVNNSHLSFILRSIKRFLKGRNIHLPKFSISPSFLCFISNFSLYFLAHLILSNSSHNKLLSFVPYLISCGVTRQDFIRSGRYLEMPDEEWERELATRKYVVGCYMKNDEWATRIKKNVGILLTSSSYGLPYLKGSVETFRKLGYWLVLSYDNFLHPGEEIDYNRSMPPRDILDQVDSFVMPHYQTWGGVSYPFMWQLKIAAGIMANFEYALVVNGDCITEKPEGFPDLLAMLGDADILSSGPALEREIGTAGLLMRSSAFMKIADHMIRHVVPFEEYEKSTQDFGNTEGRLAVAVRDLGLKQAICKPPFNEQHHEPGGGWYETIGFRHIHGEHNYAYRYHKIPPQPQYFDERFMGDEFTQIKAYWEEKYPAEGKRILENWWTKD